MAIDRKAVQDRLKKFDFTGLFTQELGWDFPPGNLAVAVDGQSFDLNAVAHKRGVVAYVCTLTPDLLSGHTDILRKIERQVEKSVHAHVLIFTDGKHTQIWQWARREPGKPVSFREHRYSVTESPEPLLQKIRHLFFTLDEEDALTHVDVLQRFKEAGVYAEQVTKRFYDQYKKEHEAFLAFIEGIPDKGLARWYTSVMLNRLIFIYFIQEKDFLDGNRNYLRDKLAESQAKGKDRYYLDFLCPLFFEGFAKPESERNAETQKLLGKIPYLNGGIFERHEIERHHGKTIRIADKAFERIFDFFKLYRWHLDERPLRNADEINPDVLGYIFEKYTNQREMGAYYTKEDITDYIGRNTVIPCLFDKAQRQCKVSFEGPQAVWRLLADDPDRYIYGAMRHGTDQELPKDIAAGLKDVSKRDDWNKTASPEQGLPTETWREVASRRKRYEETRKKLAHGEVCNINELITHNLNIRLFAQDVISNCEGPDLLAAFWQAITSITVLDPTCGSGAFLFAALNILKPLYATCLDRMQVFLDEWGEVGKKKHPKYQKLFSEILKQIGEHPNDDYYILKTIIVNNLFGVDIMEEATEICKLRLFLKLVAQVESVKQIEPLPDIDFNIRAGNTLVGFANEKQAEDVLRHDLLAYKSVWPEVQREALEISELFALFREQQTKLGGAVTAEDKGKLRTRLHALEDRLNHYLAEDYGVDASKKGTVEKWQDSHKPFHWFIEFYGIMRQGGFEVVIGNPPYLELREIDYDIKGFKTLGTGAVHALCIERSESLLRKDGCMSMIVPLALVSTQRMKVVQDILEIRRVIWYANFAWRPARLFDTVNRALTIFVVKPAETSLVYSTGYMKWTSDTRNILMPCVTYALVPSGRAAFWVPKLSDEIEHSLLGKMLGGKQPLGRFMSKHGKEVFYRTTGGLYWKVFTDFAPKFRVKGKSGHSSRETSFCMSDSKQIEQAIALLSSDVFWWWYTLTSNLRDLNPYDVQAFPVPESALSDSDLGEFGEKYLKDIDRNSAMLVREQKQTGRTETQSFRIQKSKPIIDEIDRALAKHYGFTDEELDFIINYDIKYRMGLGGKEESDE